MNQIKNEITSITNLATTDARNAKIKKVKNKILHTTNLANTIVLTAAENEIPDHSQYITNT